MKSLVSLFAAGAVSMSFAAPTATVVSASAVDGGQALEVTYTLTENAIVTMAVATNAAATAFLDDSQVTALSGDVNRKVLATSGQTVRTLRWECGRENVSLAGRAPSVVLTAWQLDQPPDVMAFHVLGGDSVRFYTSLKALPGGLADKRYRTSHVVMRKIPAKGVTYTRGASVTSKNTKANESTFSVSLTNDYYIGVYKFTAGQAFALTGSEYWHYNCKAYDPDTLLETPACGLSYDALRGSTTDGIDWPTTGHAVKSGSVLSLLRTNTGLTGLDLPTESEWEYAARSGHDNELWNGTSSQDRLAPYAWNRANSPVYPAGKRTMSPVGRLAPNDWGLYDTLGDVAELCLDWIDSDVTKTYTPANADEARQGPSSSATANSTRAYRGYYCSIDYTWMRLSIRNGLAPSDATCNDNGTYGFRLVCPVGF